MDPSAAPRAPVKPADVSADWLEQALRRRIPGACPWLADRRHLERHRDQMRIFVEVNDVARAAGLRASLVIKGCFMPELQIVESVYRDEVIFYRDVASLMQIRVSACFYAGSDGSLGQHIVVLENVNLSGVAFQRVIHPIGYQATASFLDNTARSHAKFWNSAAFMPAGGLSHLTLKAARSIGRPVTIKVVSPVILHKTEIGGVALGVPRDDAGARLQAMADAVALVAPTARIEGYLVTPMLSGGIECIVGVLHTDPLLVPVVIFGLVAYSSS